MFTRAKSPTLLETQIDKALQELDNHEVVSEEYAVVLERVSKLHKMKEDETSRVSKDTILVTTANLLGIMMIIRHEHVNVITSRAMSLVQKLK